MTIPWMLRLFVLPAAVLMAAAPAGAQVKKWQAGVAGGVSLYLDNDFSAPPGKASAGFKSSFLAGGWFAQELYDYLSGEMRYTYSNNSLKLEAGGQSLDFSAGSHAFHYDILWHTSPRESAVRPFFSAGGGLKGYFGRGMETASQPLQDYAILTATSQWKPLVTFGGGVKIRLGGAAVLRLEVKDYATPFPKDVIFPAPGADLGGWVHNITPMAGFGFSF